MKKVFLFYTSMLVVALDQLLKYIVVKGIGLGSQLRLSSWLMLNVTTNDGIVFGLLKGANMLFIFITLFIIGVILFYYDKIPEKPQFIIATGMVLGGGIGNLIDRVFRHAVVDFIDTGIWPVFNFADMMITIGIVVLVVSVWKE